VARGNSTRGAGRTGHRGGPLTAAPTFVPVTKGVIIAHHHRR